MTGGPGEAAGRVVLVATPIGNLGDLAPRAVEVLRQADIVCCEDTRRVRALLSAAGVPAGRRLVSLHRHNEAARTPGIVARAAEGRTVAVVSDAGTPGISDPGGRLVAAAHRAGVAVTVVPGPSSVLAALVVSGLPTDRFCVEGFLPRKGAERHRRVASLAADERTAVVLESPNRVAPTLAELAAACGPDRPVAVARELTKFNEDVWRGTLAEAVERYSSTPPRGEVVLVLGGAPSSDVGDAALSAALGEHLGAGEGPRQAAAAVAQALGVSRHRAYRRAIELRSTGDVVDRTSGEGRPVVPPEGEVRAAPPRAGRPDR